jgi:hypothetical protein
MADLANTPDLSDEALTTEQPASGDQPGTGEEAPSQTTQGQPAGDAPQEQPEKGDTGQAVVEAENELLDLIEASPLDPAAKDKLKKGVMLHSDYTKKTQALASDREKIDAYDKIKARLEEQLAELGDVVTPEPDGKPLVSGQPLNQEQALEVLNDIIERKVSERLSPIQQERTQERYLAEFEKLVAEFPDAKEHWDTILDLVHTDKRTKTYLDAYILLKHGDIVARAREEGKSEGLGELKSKDNAYVAPASNPASPEGGPSEADQVFEEIKNSGGRKLFH